MRIESRISKNGSLVLSENEMPLCSTYDPLQEASQWVSRVNLKSTNHVVVLGMGAGHHVEELHKQFPNLNISVVDVRPHLFEIFEEHRPFISEKIQMFNLRKGIELDDRIFNFIEDHQPTVLCFKPAWKNHEQFFSDLFASFTFRNLSMIEKSLTREIENQVFDLEKLQAEKNLIHLRNLYESLQDFKDEMALKISVLRELWI